MYPHGHLKSHIKSDSDLSKTLTTLVKSHCLLFQNLITWHFDSEIKPPLFCFLTRTTLKIPDRLITCNTLQLMGQKSEAVIVGCKVLPICDVATLGLMGVDVGAGVEKEVKRRKAVSRMKELVRWAAAAKNAKGGINAWKVLYMKNKLGLKDTVDDASSNSSKISFRRDVGSSSTSSSVFSPFSMPSVSRSDIWTENLPSSSTTTLLCSSSNVSTLGTPKSEEYSRGGGQWITSDSDFVVLEL